MKTEEQWKSELSEAEYRVLREKATESPFTGRYYEHDKPGVYCCAGCKTPLFSSDTKYHCGCGWPSFYAPLDEENIGMERDLSHGMVRTEVHCSRCGGHLGHVFDDGPPPTGKRYCINSFSLRFKDNA